jgi:succinate dehydrogenase hydrophobic anchor subunit
MVINPLALGLELAFLIVVTGHALMGVRAILVDLGLPPRLQRSLDISLSDAGLLTVLYGNQLTWQIIH